MNALPEREVAVFNAARRLTAKERAAYLDKACASDAALRRRVEELLQVSETSAHFLEQPALAEPAAPAGAGGTGRLSVALSEKPGDQIGRYKLLQQIGEGGCGVVYVAEQQEPVRRRVALKVIKLGMDTKSVIARFEAERQALALMDHPNIAKVFDGGATETGRPYFVMELVRGLKITDYCDEKKLSTRERLDLFMQVCQAIQHAHQKGIIHRDIKPSNVLVTVNDGVPVPKVIDFGIAKATSGQQLTDKTVFTAFEQFIGTPAYMSPEQAVMTSVDVDTRSDIYALGVLLYELLTGRTPFDTEELLAIGLDEMRRTIREKEPSRPSARLSTMPDQDLSTTAQRRSLDGPKLVSELRGDLDWIVMKALEKDRARRYETANGLALDIQRHLSNEPVLACPPSNLYRFHKLVRRNKLAIAAVTAVAAALITGLGVSTWLLLQEKAARSRADVAEQEQSRLQQEAKAGEKKAQTEAAKNKQVAQFLKDMLSGVGPSVALGRDTKLLKDILDKTADRISKDLHDQPEVEIELSQIMARTYADLGLFDQSEAMAREAVQTVRSRFGNESPFLAPYLRDLGWALAQKGKSPEAEAVLREGLAIQKRLQDHHDTIPSDQFDDITSELLNVLGGVLQIEGKLSEAEAVYRESLAVQTKLYGDESQAVAATLIDLSIVLNREGKLPEGEEMERKALVLDQKLLGKEHPGVANALANLGATLADEGKLSEAESIDAEGLAMARKLLDENHPTVQILRYNLMEARTDFFVHQGRWTEAAAAAAHSDFEPTNSLHYHDRAALLVQSGDRDGYRKHCQQELALFGQTSDPDEAGGMAEDFLILPDPGVSMKVIGNLVDLRGRKEGGSYRYWYEFLKGLAEYRFGHFAEAAKWTETALSHTNQTSIFWEPTDVPSLCLQGTATLAMANYQLRETDAARAGLAKAFDLEAKLPKLPGRDDGASWRELIIANALLREARTLIEGGPQTKAETK